MEGTGKGSKQLREMMRLVERKLGALEDEQASCCGVSFTQCHAIVEIGRAQGLSLIELAERLGLDNSTMSRTVNNLVNSGLAEREIDPSDRRYITIRLTEEGHKRFKSIELQEDSYFDGIYDNIPPEKRLQVLESFEIFLSALNAKSHPSKACSDESCCGC